MKKIILSTAVAIISLFTANAQSNIYVDVNATGMNNGSSWTNAYTVMDTAIFYATPNDHILIKTGVYKQSFKIDKSIQIFGGFNGTESSYNQANPEINPVIFDADINGDDILDNYSANKTDNLTHHVNIQNFNGSFSATVEGITFKNARRTVYSGSSVFFRVEGLAVISVDFIKCKFLQNCNVSGGANGGIGGGAIGIDGLNGGSAYARFDKCWFEGNSDQSLNTYGSVASIWAGTNGEATGVFTNCVFTGNSDIGNNGGNYVIYQAGSSTGTSNTTSLTYIRNCTFHNNTNSKAMLYWNGSSNSEFAAIFQRNIISGGDSTMVIGNTATSGNQYNVNATNNYWLSSPMDNVGSLSGGNNTVGNTPGFVNAASKDFNLLASSPCLDVQNIPPSPLIAYGLTDSLDYAGNHRWYGSGIDIGAYEYQGGGSSGILELEQTVLNIYPNPTQSILYIEVKEDATINLVNALGETIATQKLNAGNNSIDVSGLASGIYFLQSEKNGTVKFVKE